jgi:3-isopropylmalate dehydratase small subunit
MSYEGRRYELMIYEGRAIKFGDNVDTDLIIPARYLNVSDRKELAKHCFADFRPGFHREVGKGDILVGGRNFGCGSSREHAPLAIKESGIGAVLAKSFARIFYRNAFNIALPILESEEAVDAINEGDLLVLDLARGQIIDKTNNRTFSSKPVPDFMMKIIEAGGLVAYIKQQKG